MGYAIKTETNEFRMVDDKSWCVTGETYSDNQPEVKATIPDAESLRLLAYADPVDGCDRYLAEAASLVAAGADPASADVKALQEKSLEVKEAIRTKYPYAN